MTQLHCGAGPVCHGVVQKPPVLSMLWFFLLQAGSRGASSFATVGSPEAAGWRSKCVMSSGLFYCYCFHFELRGSVRCLIHAEVVCQRSSHGAGLWGSRHVFLEPCVVSVTWSAPASMTSFLNISHNRFPIMIFSNYIVQFLYLLVPIGDLLECIHLANEYAPPVRRCLGRLTTSDSPRRPSACHATSLYGEN